MNKVGIEARTGQGGAAPLLIVEQGARADWPVLARAEATLVFRGGAAQLLQIAARLIAAGMARSTPAAVVAPGGHGAPAGRMRTLRTSLAELPARVAAEPVTASAVIVVGALAGVTDRLAAALTDAGLLGLAS